MHIHGIGGVMRSTAHPNLTFADTGAGPVR